MLTKKESLELAAKAAGLNIYWLFPVDGDLHSVNETREELNNEEYYPCYVAEDGFVIEWCPEHDSDDALELAVDLSMHLSIGEKNNPNAVTIAALPCGGVTIAELHAGDRYAATRAAIFKAAIEAGKKLQ